MPMIFNTKPYTHIKRLSEKKLEWKKRYHQERESELGAEMNCLQRIAKLTDGNLSQRERKANSKKP